MHELQYHTLDDSIGLEALLGRRAVGGLRAHGLVAWQGRHLQWNHIAERLSAAQLARPLHRGLDEGEWREDAAQDPRSIAARAIPDDRTPDTEAEHAEE